MKYATIFATLCALVQAASGAVRTLQKPGDIYERKNEKLRLLMQSKPAPTPPPVYVSGPYKGKGKGKGSSSKGKGKGMMMKEMMGKGSKGKGSKGKGSKGKGMDSYKGKGGSMMDSSKGKGYDSKGKGGSMMDSSKGKGGSSKGKGSDYKGKGGDAKGKGGSMMDSSKGKGGDAKGKGGDAKGKGKGKGGDAKGKGKGKGGPPTLGEIVEDSKELSMLEYALEKADLLDFFYDPMFEYTVLAPTDEAFAAIAKAYPDLFGVIFDSYWILHLVDILTMHVTEPAVYSDAITDGMEIEMFNLETITASTTDGVCFSSEVGEPSCVLVADVGAKNGVAHIVDGVIKPFWFEYTVLDIVSGIPDLDVLQSLIECSGLDEQLGGYLGMTVFAPTNDAFKDADAEYLCSKEGLPTLIDVLTYHILPFPFPSVLLEKGETDYCTVQGSDVTITYYPDEKMPEKTVAMYADANIIDVDYGAINGIVHIIDSIVFPPAPAKGKGKGKGKGSAPSKGKGKGAPAKGKGKGSAPSKGKGSSSKGKGSAPSKGKGSSSKGKGGSMGMMGGGMMGGKGKGY